MYTQSAVRDKVAAQRKIRNEGVKKEGRQKKTDGEGGCGGGPSFSGSGLCGSTWLA